MVYFKYSEKIEISMISERQNNSIAVIPGGASEMIMPGMMTARRPGISQKGR